MEVLDILKENRQKKKKAMNSNMLENRVRLEVEELAKKYLEDYSDILTFECSTNSVDALLTMKDKSPLVNKYIIEQLNETLFTISLRPIDI